MNSGVGALDEGADGAAAASVSKPNFTVRGKDYTFANKSLLCLGTENGLRKTMVSLVVNKHFDMTILIVIILNAIVMGMTDYSTVETDSKSAMYGSPKCEGVTTNCFIEKMDLFFLVVFTVEFLCKVSAMGFIGKHTYLDDAWNKLDFVVVVTGLLALDPSMGSVSSIRTFRVLRPLKSLSVVPGLQKLVVGMLKAVPELLNVVLLLFFIFIIFGILGVQLFAGQMNTRCRLTP